MWSFFRPWPLVSGIVVAALGIFFAIEGGRLAALGGSWYYVIAGVALVVSGGLFALGRRTGLWLYGLVLVGTIIWAIGEVGLDGWQLMPRVVAPAVLGVWLCMPWVAGRLGPSGRERTRWAMPGPWLGAAACVLVIILTVAAGYWTTAALHIQPGSLPQAAQVPAPDSPNTDGEWPFYGNNMQGDRFASQTQITPANVTQLEVAWTAHTDDTVDPAERARKREYHSEATPLKIGDTLYTCTPHSWVLAIDATSGKVKWTWKEQAPIAGNPYLVCRGVAYYDAPKGDPCPHRIYAPTFNARVVALDADTGEECKTFADQGTINLRDNAGPSPPGYQITTSPPLVAGGRLIIGSRIIDNEAVDEPSGVVRAYDLVSGKLIWAWDVGRSQDAIGSLPPGEVWTRGTPNVWGAITADPKLNLVYLGLGNPTPDYYNGDGRQPYDERFGRSITALDITTGKLRWTFQTVHNDLWDMDLPIGPSLVDLPNSKGGPAIPALVQTTKTGQVFLLNRATGEPIAKVEEHPVPQAGAAPGARVSPTQPFSVGMPSFTPPPLQEKDAWGATPIDQLFCRIDVASARGAGIFYPPGLTPIIGNPAFDGVTDWGGAAVDPERKVMTMNIMSMPFKIRLVDRNSDEGHKLQAASHAGGENASAPITYDQRGTPYLAVVQAWLGRFGAPCIKPPWGELVAVNLQDRQVIWRTVLGTARDSGLFGTHLGVPIPVGVPNLGGSVITRSGIVFIGATTDQYLRAFDLKTGEELWKARLPAGAQATPMIYTGKDGREYVLITAGGHGALGTRYGDATIAYALPAGA